MSKLVMIFASMSGNTEEMADHIAGTIRETGKEIEVIDMMTMPEASVLEGYDGIILGAYTWGMENCQTISWISMTRWKRLI